MMKAMFRWLDGHPWCYWLLAGCSLLLLGRWVLVAWRRRDQESRGPQSEWGFALLMLAVILAWRWPPTLAPYEFNPDEAQIVTGALTLQQDAVFWRSVDGNTSGPLNFYALLPTHWLGVPQDYFNARLTGLLLIWGALWSCYQLLRLDYGRATSALGILPGLLFFATTTDSDFLQYSTEQLSIFLFTLAAALLWRAHRRGQPNQAHPHGPWLAAGLVMGLLPWAKLQAAPLAAALAAWGTGLALRKSTRPWRARIAEVARLAAASLLPSIAVLTVILATGQWEHFTSSYIVNNLAYIENGFDLVPTIKELVRLSLFTGNIPVFLLTPLIAGVLAAVTCGAAARRPGALFLLGGSFMVVAIYCVLAPRHPFLHYLLFLVMPFTWLSGAALGELRRHFTAPFSHLALGLVYLLLATVPTLTMRARQPLPPVYGQLEKSWREPYDEAGKLLRQYRQPGDLLAVWGWNCHLHVQSGLPQATREAVSERQIRDSDQRDSYYRPRYLADLKRNKPTFFVDAVGPGAFGFTNRALDAHETFPELRFYVRSQYMLLRDLGYVRVYMRTDRNLNTTR